MTMDKGLFGDKRSRLILIAAFAWGIFAHGTAMFYKFSYHDDAAWFNGVGETYGLGRWGLGAAGDITERIYQSRIYSTPVINGAITILAIAVMVYLLCLRMKIYDRIVIVALCGVFVCFPSVTNIFGYVFTAPYYYTGALLAVAGPYIYYRKKSIISFIVCTLFLAFSTGLYQSNIAVGMITLLLFMLEEVFSSDTDWKGFWILTAKSALICICFMAEYFGFNAIFLRAKGLAMYDYKGVSSFGMTDPAGYVTRVLTAYKRFIKPADYINYNGVSTNMFPWNLKYLHMLMIVITIVLLLILLMHSGAVRKKIQTGILLAVSPLFSYFIYVMVSEEDAYGGMAFAEVFMFVITAYAIERIRENPDIIPDALRRIRPSVICAVPVICMLVMGFMFARFANVCYLKAEVMQSEAISYYNTLITRIRTTEGYTDDVPVAYIGPRAKNDDGFMGDVLFDPIYLPPYQGNSIINDFAWEETMNIWCGFSRVEAAPEAVGALRDEIIAMPCYPEEGSVKMLDGTLVVKFADTE